MQFRGLLNYRFKYCWLKDICCNCQPNKLKREIKHTTGKQNWGPGRSLRVHDPPRPTLRNTIECAYRPIQSPARARGRQTLVCIEPWFFCRLKPCFVHAVQHFFVIFMFWIEQGVNFFLLFLTKNLIERKRKFIGENIELFHTN